jgi:hypothetical protein
MSTTLVKITVLAIVAFAAAGLMVTGLEQSASAFYKSSFNSGYNQQENSCFSCKNTNNQNSQGSNGDVSFSG